MEMIDETLVAEACKEYGHIWTWFPKNKRTCYRCGVVEDQDSP